MHLWTWIGRDKRGESASFSVKEKEIEAPFLQVSLYEFLLPTLDEKHMLFVSTIELMINLASLTFPSSIRWTESLKIREVSSHYFDL